MSSMTTDQVKEFDRLLGQVLEATGGDYNRARTELLGFLDHVSKEAIDHATTDARATVSRLNRRAQRAEAAVEMKVEQFQQRSKTALRDYYVAKGMEIQSMVRYLRKGPPPPVSALELKDARASGDNRRAWEVVGWLIATLEQRILHWVTSFSLRREFELHSGGFFKSVSLPKVGSLVALTSAPATKWYLSWVIEVVHHDRVLLESIEDGSLCWWGNVGFLEFTKADGEDPIHESWRWTDRQFAFSDRWERIVRRHPDGYVYRSRGVSFGVDHSVTVGVRVMHAISPHTSTRTYEDFRKVKVSTLREFFEAGVAEIKKRDEADRKTREAQQAKAQSLNATEAT